MRAMKILGFTSIAVVFVSSSVALSAADHPCAVDAARRAKGLLEYHFGEDDRIPSEVRGPVQRVGTMKAIRGQGRFDILQVSGYKYKAEYRIRLIYAQVSGSCVLMGQEILESGSPF
jgi:hypothetical protein